MNKPSKAISVSSRIRNAILSLALGLCLVFGGLMFFIMFIVEDEIFVKQIHAEQNEYEAFLNNRAGANIQKNWQPTNGNMRILNSVAELKSALPKELTDEFIPSLLEHTGIYEHFDEQYALFISHQNYNGKTFFLIYDVSKLLAVRGSKTVLFSFILIITLIAALLSIVIAHTLAKNTLTPIKGLINELQEHGFNSTAINQARQFSNDEIGLLTHELALAIERQSAAAKREFEFNRGVSHELRSPIQVAQSTCELLMTINADSSIQTEQLNQPLHRLKRATDEMSEIAHAFLVLSSEQNSQQQEFCSLRQLKELISNTQQHKAIHVIYTAGDSHCYPMNASILSITLRHLIRNAHTHGTEGSITIEFDKTTICISNKVALSDASHKGYGIGLSVVKALFERSEHSLVISQTNNSNLFKAKILFNS